MINKTEILVLHAKHRPKPPLDSITVGDATVEPTSNARNFGAIFDDTTNFGEHVIELLYRTAFFHIRNISRVRPCLGIYSAKTLMHAVLLRFHKDLRPHLSFSYPFRPSTLQLRMRFENSFIPSVRMLKWPQRMRISIYRPAKLAPFLNLSVASVCHFG